MTLEVFFHLAFLSLRLKFVPVSGLPSSSVSCGTGYLLFSPSGRTCLQFPLPFLSSPLGLPLGEASPDHSLYTRAHDYKFGFQGTLLFLPRMYHCVETVIHIYPCDFSQNVCLHLWNGSTMTAGALAIRLMLLYLMCLAWFLAYGPCSTNIC